MRFPSSTGKASTATSFTIALATLVEVIAPIDSPCLSCQPVGWSLVLHTPQGLRRHAHDLFSYPLHFFRAHSRFDTVERNRFTARGRRLEGRCHSASPRNSGGKK